jgi:Rieske Fe-S protein
MRDADSSDAQAAGVDDQQGGVTRRSLLAGVSGAGVVAALGGCSTYGGSDQTQPAPPPATVPPGQSAPPLATVADIPVNGGKIFKDRKVVLTQPSQGTIKAFSTVCTHQGCDVEEVKDGTINCPCHQSKFNIADGSVTGGPATAPLPPVNVTVNGDAITLA